MTIAIIIAAIFVATLGFVVLFGAPYVPSKPKELRQAFTILHKIGKDDTIVDIGSGDGMVLRMASRLGAKAVGYEINPLLVLTSRFLSRGDKNVIVHTANVWRAKFPKDTTVVYVFGESRDIKKIARLVENESKRLHRELILISYGFELPGKKAHKKHGAHFMYKISPLHP